MNRWALVFVILMASLAPAQTAAKNPWAVWEPFLGTWVGSGSGQPGEGAGEFSVKPELQGAVLVRRNYAEYPATKDKPAYRHDDLMVIYGDGDKTRADYWDNEGHVIHYGVEASAGKLVLLSDAGAGRAAVSADVCEDRSGHVEVDVRDRAAERSKRVQDVHRGRGETEVGCRLGATPSTTVFTDPPSRQKRARRMGHPGPSGSIRVTDSCMG